MCGIEGHGFYWSIENELRELDYEVVFGLEINSHSSQRNKYKIPANAKRLGFNPVNGEIISNDSEPIPERVREKASLLFEAYFPNKEAIAGHIKRNYAKNYDKEEWDMKLPSMLEDGSRGLFSKKYFTQRAQYYTQWVQDYTQQAQDFTQRAQDCTQRAQDSFGTLDEMDIDKFIDYFLKHPNSYWAERNEPLKVEYQELVRA